ncbi:MAG: ureidoglycolate lyase [Rhizobiaceae bacterium]
MTATIKAQPLTAEAFAPFGQVLQKEGAHDYLINSGNCTRYHDLANVETTGDAARTLISIFTAKPFAYPLELTMVERHPLGSQAFYPLSGHPWLVIVCPDEGGKPGAPIAFEARANQGVNIGRNVWHAVLTPLVGVSDFLVVDRGGEGVNLEEYIFERPLIVTRG